MGLCLIRKSIYKRKKRRCYFNFSKITPSFALFEYLNIRLRLVIVTCTRANHRFLYSEESRGECISGQHTICFHILLYFSRNTVPIGFCWGGFSSTAGYVPGNEAQCRSNERLLPPFGCSFPKVIVRFYPNNSKNLATFLSKAFRLRCRA